MQFSNDHKDAKDYLARQLEIDADNILILPNDAAEWSTLMILTDAPHTIEQLLKPMLWRLANGVEGRRNEQYTQGKMYDIQHDAGGIKLIFPEELLLSMAARMNRGEGYGR